MNRKRAPELAAETRRCAVYTRKSTAAGLEQAFNSLDAQREACIAYIQRQQGWTLLPEHYDDGGFTGANTERPAFQRLLGDVEAGKIDVVVVYKVDRLSRSLLDFAKVMERLGKAGASFVSVTQNFSTADAMGRLTLNMLMSFAEFEREMICERTRDKIAAARRKGKWTGGTVPLGYQVVEKRLVIDELEAVTVREVFSFYAEHRSALAVAKILNEKGRRTKTHTAKTGRVRPARAWTKADVLQVLRCPLYGGFMRSNGSLHPSEHPAIVDAETFSRARGLLEGRGGSGGDVGRKPAYLLTGLLRCACCGSAFTPASTRKGAKEYRYYRCVKRDKEGREACPSAPLPAGAIEEFVVERLREAIAEGGLADDVTVAVRAKIEARRKELTVERKQLPKRIATLSDDGRKLAETVSGLSERARRVAEKRLEEIGEQLTRAEARLSAVTREHAALEAAEVEAEWVSQVLTEFTSVWDVLTPANRRRLFSAVVQAVEVDEPGNSVRVSLVELSRGLAARQEAVVA